MRGVLSGGVRLLKKRPPHRYGSVSGSRKSVVWECVDQVKHLAP